MFDKVAYQSKYYQEHKKEINAKMMAYYHLHKDEKAYKAKRIEFKRRYYRLYKAEILNNARVNPGLHTELALRLHRESALRWYKAHRLEVAEYKRRYRNEHKAEVLEAERVRRAKSRVGI